MNEQTVGRFALATGLAIGGSMIDGHLLAPAGMQQPEHAPAAVSVQGEEKGQTGAVEDRLCEPVSYTNLLEPHTNRLSGQSIVPLNRGLETTDSNCKVWTHVQGDELTTFVGLIANPRDNAGPWACDPPQVVNHDWHTDCRADMYSAGGRIGMSALVLDARDAGSFLLQYTVDGTTEHPTLLKISEPVAWSYLPLALESAVVSAGSPQAQNVDIFTWKSDQPMRDQVYLPIAVVATSMSGQIVP